MTACALVSQCVTRPIIAVDSPNPPVVELDWVPEGFGSRSPSQAHPTVTNGDLRMASPGHSPSECHLCGGISHGGDASGVPVPQVHRRRSRQRGGSLLHATGGGGGGDSAGPGTPTTPAPLPPPRGLWPTVSSGGSWRPKPRGRPPPRAPRAMARPGTRARRVCRSQRSST